jgi:hypothetical protein
MDEERLEQKLRDYFKTEVKKVEPSPEWWDNAVTHLGERKISFWEKYGGWLNRPLWRAVVPLALVVMVVGVLWGTGILPGFRGVPSPTQPPVIGGMGGAYPVIVSSVMEDSSGGALIAYRVEVSPDGQDARMLRISSQGDYLWNKIIFAGEGKRCTINKLVTDDIGNAVVAWSVSVPDSEKKGAYNFDHSTVAKVDSDGQILWQKDLDVEIIGMITDGSGGVVVAWQNRDGFSFRRIDAGGATIWERNISEKGFNLQLASAQDGSILALWDNLFNNSFVVHKLGMDGNFLWGADGIQISYFASPLEYRPQVVGDGAGGAIISWAEASPEGKMNLIVLSRIAAEGNLLWRSSLRSLSSTVHPETRLVSDGPSGAIVFWEDHRQGMAIYAQKINAEGQAQWQENGMPLYAGLPNTSPRFAAVSDGTGGAVITVRDANGSLFAQRLDASGNKLWGERLAIAENVANLPLMISAADGDGIIIGWVPSEEQNSKNAFVQKVDLAGKLLWGTAGVGISK